MPLDARDDIAAVPWPAAGTEDLAWESEFDPQASRRSQLRTRGPYRACVRSEIATSQPPPFDRITAVAIEDAVVELSRFDAEFGDVTAPFASILLRSESAASSEIERLTAGPRGIAMAELGRKSSANAKLIVANVRAMEAAVSLAGDLDEAGVISMQRALLEDTHPEYTGDWRHEPVWVGGIGNSPHGASFVPPRFERVGPLMADVVAFARRADWPVIPQVAIAHAQFETIHPFPDGNGRTGRALIHAMLHRLGITRNVTVPVSAGLLQDTERYFDALTSYRMGDAGPIVRVFTDAVTSGIKNGRTLVSDLNEIGSSWRTMSTSRAGSSADRMLDLLRRQPVVDAQLAARELGVTPQNAQIGIDRLLDDGVLTQIGDNRRHRTYEARDVITVLDEFAQRARRRSRGA